MSNGRKFSRHDSAQLHWNLIVMGWERSFAIVPGILRPRGFNWWAA